MQTMAAAEMEYEDANPVCDIYCVITCVAEFNFNGTAWEGKLPTPIEK